MSAPASRAGQRERRSGERQTLGRYVLFDEIASGGMASVHYGRMRGSVGFARSVAVKRLHPHLSSDPDFVAMFLDEARLAARIHHSNVVDTLDVVTVRNEIILVMEYVHGESLSMLLKAVRRAGTVVPPPIAAAIVSGMLHGLHAAHEATSEQGTALDIVHRDVSPQNVIVGADGVARVLDFGVAKALTRTQTTREGQLKGKLAYMAPEQLRRGLVDRRTDVYAASVVLWETLTAERLHDADDEGGLVASILEAKCEAPSAHVADVSAELDAVVMRGLAASSDDRFSTALAMADALERAIVPARPREVGEWVAGVARVALTKRAEKLAMIERVDLDLPDVESGVNGLPQGSSRAPAAAPADSELATMRLDEEESRVKAVSVPGTNPAVTAVLTPQVTTNPRVTVASPASSSRSSRVVIAIAALLGVVFVLAAGFGVRTVLVARAARLTPPVPSASASVTADPAAIASEAPVASSPTASGALALAPTPPATVTASATVKRASPGPAAAGSRPKRFDECDPPFTIDEAGVKRFKKKCL